MPQSESTPEPLLRPFLSPELDQLRLQIVDWAQLCLMHWDTPTGDIPVTPIWISWTNDPRLNTWTDLALEIDCAAYPGNGSGLAFAFPFETVKHEYQSGKAFRTPDHRFLSGRKGLFSLGGLPGEVSYLLGAFYSHRLHANFAQIDPGEALNEYRPCESQCFLVLNDPSTAPHALVRIIDRGHKLEQSLQAQDPAIQRIIDRPDIIGYHHLARCLYDRSWSELYLEIDLAAARANGYLASRELQERADRASNKG